MATYGYRLPAYGDADGMPNFTTTMLEEQLRNGKESLMFYYVFRSEERALTGVSLEMDARDNVIAVNLYTSEEVIGGRKHDLAQCVQRNLAAVAWQNYDNPFKSCVTLDGYVEDLGLIQEEVQEVRQEPAEIISFQEYLEQIEAEKEFTEAVDLLEGLEVMSL